MDSLLWSVAALALTALHKKSAVAVQPVTSLPGQQESPESAPAAAPSDAEAKAAPAAAASPQWNNVLPSSAQPAASSSAAAAEPQPIRMHNPGFREAQAMRHE